MTDPEIYSRLTRIFHDLFEDDGLVLGPTLSAAEVPEWDSLSHIRLVLSVQKDFGVRFSASQIASLNNVSDLVLLIQNQMER